MPDRPIDNDNRPRRPFLIRVGLALFSVCTILFLSLLLLAQTVLLVVGSTDLPGFLTARLEQELHQHGWRVEYRNLRYRLPATVEITAVRLTPAELHEPLVEADYGRVDFALLPLFVGRVRIDEATLYGGTLFCPAPHSPTGIRERVVDRLHAVIRQREHQWHLHNLNGRMHNLAFTASGSFPEFPERERTEEPLSPLAFLSFLPELVRQRETFALARNPGLRLDFAPAAGKLLVVADAWADSVRSPVPHSILIRQPRLTATWQFDGRHWQGLSSHVEAARVDATPYASAEMVSASFDWTPSQNRTNLFPDRATFSIDRLLHPAATVEGVQIRGSLDGASLLSWRLFALLSEAPVEADGRIDWETGDGRFRLISRARPEVVLRSEFVKNLGLNQEIGFAETPFVRLEGELRGWQPSHIHGYAIARQANIDGVFLDHATARAEFHPGERFHVPEMVLRQGDFETIGSYEVDFESKAYRLRFLGTVRPLHISAWFREWWPALWSNLTILNTPVRGDIDIRSVHGHADQTELFGRILVHDFLLRGVPFDSLDGELTVRHGWVEMRDLTVNRPEGEANGWFQYAFASDGSDSKLDFHADSRMDPVEVARAFGEGDNYITSHFRFSKPPALQVHGTIYPGDQAPTDHITVSGHSDAPLSFHGLPLDRLSIDASLEGSNLHLRRIDAGLAGGSLAGEASKWDADGEEMLNFSLLVNDLDMSAGLRAVTEWRIHNAPSVSPANLPKDVGGRADLQIQAAGLFHDPHSFTGSGNFRIHDADLAQVHLLGLLSRILNSTPLGFTSLQFKEAKGDFLIDLERLRFQELLLTGATAEIRASGDYLIPSDTLDFAVRLHLMRESRVPFLSLLLTPVMQPLAHMLEIHLTGSPSDPDWKFLLGPRNILTGFGNATFER